MTTRLYGIPNCDTVRKARKALEAAGTDYEFHDYKKAGADAAQIEGWAKIVGMDRLLNKRGTTWRKLNDAEQARADTAAGASALMAEHPSLIKRPVVEHGKKVLVGFNEAEWTASRLL